LLPLVNRQWNLVDCLWIESRSEALGMSRPWLACVWTIRRKETPMIRSVLALAATFAFCALLSGCGTGGGGNAVTAQEKAEHEKPGGRPAAPVAAPPGPTATPGAAADPGGGKK
jgi:hypothetical protein